MRPWPLMAALALAVPAFAAPAQQDEAVEAAPMAPAAQAATWLARAEAAKKAGFPYAALLAYEQGLKADPGTMVGVLDGIVKLADQLDETRWIGGTIGADLSVPMDAKVRGEVAYAAAQHHFEQGNWGTVLPMLALVPADHPKRLDADILQGVTLAQQGRYGEALPKFVAGYEKAKRSREPHEVATLALNSARTFYAAGDKAQAMAYYAKVPRGDAWWPQAHYELAWAHFAVDDMPGTLGRLQTHASPFFDDWYFPEAMLLRAQALFLMCMFPETTKAIDDFQSTYQPLADALRAVVGTLDAEGALAEGRAVLEGGTPKAPASVLRRFQSDARFADAVAGIAEADAELSRLSASSFQGADTVKPLLQARRDARVATEGGRVLEALRTAQADLDDMLSGIELTRVDLLTLEADMYSRAASSGELFTPNTEVADAARRTLRRKGKRVWPFEGEYWADELGWYRVDRRPDCPEAMQRGE